MYEITTEPPQGAAQGISRTAAVTTENALWEGEEMLSAAGVENPRRDAEALLAHCLGVEPWRLILERETVLSSAEAAKFQQLLTARRTRRPLAYILGWAGFHDLILDCDPRALIPRPETELLVEKALEFLAGRSDPEVIEIGGGSGAIALALARQLPGARIGVSDISPAALALARENAVRLGLEERIDFRAGDLFGPWDDRRGRGVDLIVSNPPYLGRDEIASAEPEVGRYEPRQALDGGEDGLAVIRRLVAGTPLFLRAGGRLMIEIGASQGPAVRMLADSATPVSQVSAAPALVSQSPALTASVIAGSGSSPGEVQAHVLSIGSGPSPVIARSLNEVRATKQSHPGENAADPPGVRDCFSPPALAMTDSGARSLEFIELVKDYCGRDRVAVFGKRNGEY